ncbi:hypothetical protein YC2023_001761 [Brassica napus]
MKAHIQETMFVGGLTAAVQARMKAQKSKETKEKNERESQPAACISQGQNRNGADKYEQENRVYRRVRNRNRPHPQTPATATVTAAFEPGRHIDVRKAKVMPATKSKRKFFNNSVEKWNN